MFAKITIVTVSSIRVNNGPIFNLLALLELSQSPISFYDIMLKQLMQMKEYVYLQCQCT